MRALIPFTLAAAIALVPAIGHGETKPTNAQTIPMPQLVQTNGKFALMVDGAPYLVLGGQAHNSSNYPAELDKVWPAIKDMNANTLFMPVTWEQVEPTEGHFDFSFVDTLVTQARQHNVRLGLLWFGTWKNSRPYHTPSWVKTDNQRFPRLINMDGSTSYALSPLYDSTREADKRAYVELLKHIKAIDSQQHTVILMQCENEVGVYGAARDYSPKADTLMNQPVPAALVAKLGKKPGTWHEVFGANADESFYAWSLATYVDDIVAAGKAVYPLPTYMNAALKDPLDPNQTPGSYESGGPTYNVLDIYKVAAPHIDLLAPDLYSSASPSYEATLNLYHRADNALFVAESGNRDVYARYIYTVLGQQGIGFDPFGIDYTGYSNYPLGAKLNDETMVAPFGDIYRLFAPMAREWAKLSFETQVWGVSEPDDHSAQGLDLGPKWHARVTYRQWQMGSTEWGGYRDSSETPSGGVVVAKLSDNEFLVAGLNARIDFDVGPANKGKGFLLDRVEEGHYDKAGNWVFERLWNGDQTDFGLNLTKVPRLLKVRLATYTK